MSYNVLKAADFKGSVTSTDAPTSLFLFYNTARGFYLSLYLSISVIQKEGWDDFRMCQNIRCVASSFLIIFSVSCPQGIKLNPCCVSLLKVTSNLLTKIFPCPSKARYILWFVSFFLHLQEEEFDSVAI